MILTWGYELREQCAKGINNYLRQPSLFLISKNTAKILLKWTTFSREPCNREKQLPLRTAMVCIAKCFVNCKAPCTCKVLQYYSNYFKYHYNYYEWNNYEKINTLNWSWIHRRIAGERDDQAFQKSHTTAFLTT